MDQKTVWLILRNQQLYPHHPQRAQAMCPEDSMPRVNFCRWFLHRFVDEPDFPRGILFTDEAKCIREGDINFRKTAMFGLFKTRVLRAPMAFSNATVSTCVQRFLNTYSIGSWNMCHCMCVKTYGFSTMAHHLILLVRFEVI